MPYRSAILAALEDLKDHQTGSPASSIRRRMLDRASAAVASSSSKARTGNTNNAAVVDSDVDDAVEAAWSTSSFRRSLNSLVRDGTLVRVGGGGSNYKLSDKRLMERARGLEAIAEERMEATAEDFRTSAAAMAAMAAAPCEAVPGGNVHDGGNLRHRHPREEPPKELPKRRTFHSKIKMGDADTVSAVVAPGEGTRMARRRDDDGMDTDDDRTDHHRAFVKIVPRRDIAMRGKVRVDSRY
ncbi:hypothetical protein ACHAW5_006465 [Stephanodiscus triporus]|uniref:H15 domain-containing protein n=1 Tax=Stephanodiscus triporus TaxID=2934178 RepID=A0ABD3NZ15_9STRA